MARDIQEAGPDGDARGGERAVALPLPGLDDAARSRFGLDRDDESWLTQCRRSRDGPTPARLGAYALLAEAGSGAQGRVYKAVQPGTGRVVAIKRLGAGRFASEAMQGRFEREVRALSSLSHPGVVTVFGADEVEGQRVLLMEWIDGVPIDAWARGRPLRDRIEALVRLCDAVRHAHQRGVIHRDLKPSNILVDASGQPRVLDFGLAKLLEDDAGEGRWTRTSAFVGTPAYAAPEQAAGASDTIDTRTDVYALGVILYELLTGALPIPPRADLGAMLSAVRLEEPRRPSSLDPSLGTELDAITLKALAKEPERRYQSVDALGADARRYLAGQTVLAYPPSAAYHVRKFVRRHRAAVAAAGVIVGLLLGGAAATAWQAVRATRAEAAASDERDAARLEARRAEAVRAFLTDMLADAEPERAGTSALTVREAVDRAAARLDAGALKDQPEIEDAVRLTLGRTYSALGDRGASLRQLRWVAAHRERAFGARSPAVAEALHWLGREYRAAGELGESEAALARSLEMYSDSGRPVAARRALLSMGHLYAIEQPDRAIPILTDLIQTLERTPGPKTGGELAWAHFGLARAYHQLGRPQESDAAYARARPQIDREFGPFSSNRVMFYRLYCADVLFPAEREQEIVDILRPLLDAMREPYGPEHPDTVRIQASLGLALVRLDRAAEAEPLLRECLDVLERTQPASSLRIFTTRSMLGAALSAMGRDEEAEPLLVAAFEGIDAHHRDAAIERARALQRVVRFYERRNRPDLAGLYRGRRDGSAVISR